MSRSTLQADGGSTVVTPAAGGFLKTIVLPEPVRTESPSSVEPEAPVAEVVAGSAQQTGANFHVHPRLILAVVIAGFLLTGLLIAVVTVVAPQSAAPGALGTMNLITDSYSALVASRI